MRPRIAVVGAGAVGLSTAVCIQEQIPDADVTVVADKFDASTTSDGAAGLFTANQEDVPGIPEDVSRYPLSSFYVWMFLPHVYID